MKTINTTLRWPWLLDLQKNYSSRLTSYFQTSKVVKTNQPFGERLKKANAPKPADLFPRMFPQFPLKSVRIPAPNRIAQRKIPHRRAFCHFSNRPYVYFLPSRGNFLRMGNPPPLINTLFLRQAGNIGFPMHKSPVLTV